jgi:pSer/pThr/pTyr-binding forkhead associated (FHA) protein
VNDFKDGADSIDATRTFSENLIPVDANSLSDEDQQAVDALPTGNSLLIVRRGPNKGARFLLDSDLISIGRHPNADIFLDDVTVSRRHSEISRAGSVFTIKDLASLNGTYFEGKRVETAELFNGAEVQVGKYHFTYYSSKRNS